MMEENKIRILVACHKTSKFPQNDVYLPIQVGKATSQVSLGIQGDNTGDNISKKNSSYCELTALYWAWKNLKNVDYIGLCHYRRYFDFHKQVPQYLPVYYEKSEKLEQYDFTLSKEALKVLDNGGVIIPKKNIERQSLVIKYCLNHISDDLRILYQVISEYPDKIYAKVFHDVMFGNKCSYFNMFIMPWTIFQDYCQWLFSILNSMEEMTDISHYNSVQKRIYGYMGERLLNVYLCANHLQEYQLPIITFDDNKIEKNKSWVRYYLEAMIKRVTFTVTLSPVFKPKG